MPGVGRNLFEKQYCLLRKFLVQPLLLLCLFPRLARAPTRTALRALRGNSQLGGQPELPAQLRTTLGGEKTPL